MTTLDYAQVYETQFRHRRRRTLWLRLLAVTAFTLWPLAVVGAMALR
jgi:hypothetical protein